MKHVGKMKNNGARVCIVYRTLPNDPYNALVVGTGQLGDAYHDALMTVVQDQSGQQANELADILAVRKFPDGVFMLEWLHTKGHLKKVPTNNVLVTPAPNQSIQLDELNVLIAEQKGVSLEDLAISEGGRSSKKDDVSKTTSASVNAGDEQIVEQIVKSSKPEEPLNAAQLRSKADKLFKEAQQLRKQADALDPPKPRVRKVTASV